MTTRLLRLPFVACGGRARRVLQNGLALICMVIVALPGQAWAAEHAGVLAVVRTGGASLFEAPGRNVIQALAAGDSLTAVGRDGGDRWVVVLTDNRMVGWVEADRLFVFTMADLPVVFRLEGSAGQPATSRGTAGLAATVETGGARLNVRAGPGTEYPIVGKAQSGESLTVLARSDDASWAEVALPGQTGWVAARYLQVTDSLAALPTSAEADHVAARGPGSALAAGAPAVEPRAGLAATVETGGARLNVRAGPGTEYPVVDHALSGQPLTVVARNGDASWSQVELPGQPDRTGWVAARYLDASAPLTALAISEQVGDPAGPSALGGPAAGPVSALAANAKGQLVFQSSHNGVLYVLDLADDSLRPLTVGADPALSPDGGTVAFVRGGGRNGLYLVGVDGSQEQLIYADQEPLRAPDWSPDGSWIVFSRGSGQDQDLAVVDPDGGNFQELGAGAGAGAPDWSEGGIVYQSADGIQVLAGQSEAALKRTVLSDSAYQDPAWQPGGDRIVVQIWAGERWALLAVNPDGSGLVPLAPSPANDVAPAWNPDGRSLIFLSDRGGRWGLWTVDAGGSEPQPLAVDVAFAYDDQGEQVVDWGQ